MTQRRHIWTFPYGSLEIHKEDINGNIITGGPVIEYCFFEGLNITEQFETTRRNVFGRTRRKITRRAAEYNASIQHLYLSKRIEHNTEIFNRSQRIRVIFKLEDNAYSGVDPYDNDFHTLKKAVTTEFEISGQEDQNMIASVNFEAEDFE